MGWVAECCAASMRPQASPRMAPIPLARALFFTANDIRPWNRPVSTRSVSVRAPENHVRSPHGALQELRDTKGLSRYALEKKSSIIAIGLTVHSAPLDLREKLAVPEAEWPRASHELCSYPHIQEAAVLSTCNRLEMYLVGLSFRRAVREAEDWLSRASGVDLEVLRPHLFLLRDGDAVAHLLRVAAGLDSLVLGEGQILAQVKQVHKVGQTCPGFGRHLNGLFKAAVTAGKRTRTETGIAAGAVSVSSAAVELAAVKLAARGEAAGPSDPGKPALRAVDVCVVGAGRMSRLLLKHLSSKDCERVVLVNRGLPRAEALAAEFPGLVRAVRPMSELAAAASEADVIFTASASETLLIGADTLRDAVPRPDGPRLVVDIAVPRNVDPGLAGSCRDVEVYNVDDLREVVEGNRGERARAAAEAEALLEGERAAFEAWRDSLETVPTIKALRAKAECIRLAEFEKTMTKMGEDLPPRQRKAVEELSRAIVNKLLHGPMTALRCDGADPCSVNQTLANMEALERMFDLAESTQNAILSAARASK